jgi:hypothetical protein
VTTSPPRTRLRRYAPVGVVAMSTVRLLPGFGALLGLVILAGCASTPSPTPSPSTASPASSPSPASSSSPAPAASALVTCLPETGPLPSGFGGDPCPSAIAAIRAVVAPLRLTIARLRIEPGPFECGDLWPGVGTPPACRPPVIPGRDMHGWVSFVGTDRVAAVALVRQLPDGALASTPGPWQATLLELEDPPGGWVMP